MVRLRHLLDAAVEAFDHAVGLWVHRWRQAMFDTQIGAELIEFVPAGGAALAQTEQAVGELLAIVGQDGTDADRTGAFEIAQVEPTSAIGSSPMARAGVGCGRGVVDADKDPPRRPVDGDEQVAP